MENDYKKLTHTHTDEKPCKFPANLLLIFITWFSSINWSLCIFAQLVAEELVWMQWEVLHIKQSVAFLFQAESWVMTMWLSWELRQIVKHEKVVVIEKSLFSRFVINLDLFIYSLIHRPEYLRLVLNCCFELVKVWVKDWAVF